MTAGGLAERWPLRARSRMFGRRCLWAAVAGLAVLVASGALAVGTARAASSDQAVAYQLDAAHDGYQSGDPIAAPLSQAWSVSLGGSISYPLIVNGVVYVTVTGSGTGTTLYAIQQATGSTLWSHALGGTYPWSGLAYDAGRVFTVNTNGTLSASDAETGASDWSVSLPGQTSFDSPPTALNGYVYTSGSGSGGTLYAVSEGTGKVAWTQAVTSGDNSSPAVDDSNVYVTYACDQDYDFDPFTGTPVWHHSTSCSGGGGKTPVLANCDVFGRDAASGNVVLGGSTGNTVGSFASTAAPAVGGGSAYMVGGGELTAVACSGLGSNRWIFDGDGKIDTAPLLVGNLVFVGSSGGNVYAVDASSGATDWSTALGSAVLAPDEQNVSQPLTGLGAGEGTLIVPAGTSLTAFTGANVGTGTPADDGAPSVVGTPVVGQPVGADVGTWTGLPTSYTFQWADCPAGGSCADITGATGDSYTPTSSQLGTTLKVSVTATDASGTSSAVVSQQSVPVASPPIDQSAPTVSGVAAYGQTLTASQGSWTQSPTGFSYQWLRCQNGACTPVTGATSSTYKVAAADIGSDLEAEVTAVNSVGALSATSQPTSVVPTVATTLSLTSSANPVMVGDSVTFTATLSPNVDGGTVTFSEDGQPLSWCESLPVDAASSTVTCSGIAESPGESVISAAYSGDSDLNSSTSSLTEDIDTATPPPAPPPPTVTLTGTPSAASTSPAIYYHETGNVTSTVCYLDGQPQACDSSHAVLSQLGAGGHIFIVEVYGAGGTAHATVKWTVVSAGGVKLGVPGNFRAHRIKGRILLTWTAVSGARSYSLSVTVGKRTRADRLGGSTHSFRLSLSRRGRAAFSLRAIGANGKRGPAAHLSVS